MRVVTRLCPNKNVFLGINGSPVYFRNFVSRTDQFKFHNEEFSREILLFFTLPF